MKILITIPNWTNPHGGLRVIMEWANRLTAFGHEVYLYNLKGEVKCEWFRIDRQVKLCDITELWNCETVILTSPHSSHLLDMVLPGQKCFLFLQMMEDMFKPNDLEWLMQCRKFYTSQHPLVSISEWNIEMLRNKFGRAANFSPYQKTFYVGNGVNTDEFPIQPTLKDGKVVLIEGWECTNPSKDSENISHTVAFRLRSEGYTIIAYSGAKIRTNKHLLHEAHCRPDIAAMNNLYSRATIMIKASKYDARSCSPMEAMTKSTVTARAIIQGDDDLQHGYNCLRCGYDAEELYKISKTLLTSPTFRGELAANGVEYLQQYSWDYWMNKINKILCNV